jgi:uncharacterized protein
VIPTPCIGVCSTGIGDSVCRGCKRFSFEIIDWNRYSSDQKRCVLARIDSLTCRVLRDRVVIFAPDRLEAKLRQHGVRYNPEQSHYMWFFELLRAGAGQIQALESFGVRLNDIGGTLSLVQLKQQIEQDVFQLSELHYKRYFEVRA